MMDHLAAARRELDLARADPKCGSCREVLDAEAEHLNMVTEAMISAEVLSTTQGDATETYASGIAVARSTLKAAGLPPVAPSASAPSPPDPPKKVGMVREILSERVRITDVFGGLF
jgi:hypothetical protein